MKLPINSADYDFYEVNGYKLSHLLRIAEFCNEKGVTPYQLFSVIQRMDELQGFIKTEQAKMEHDILRRLLTNDRP